MKTGGLTRDRAGRFLFLGAILALAGLCAYGGYVSRAARPLGEILGMEGQRVVRLLITRLPERMNGPSWNGVVEEGEELEGFLALLEELEFTGVLVGDETRFHPGGERLYELGLVGEEGERTELSLITTGKCFYQNREYRLKEGQEGWETILAALESWEKKTNG
ncbi:MAG: hypothetical protein HFF05_03020 [Oscillospiraceae bacterium]|nr:hypothetical protein [Oscillospiraceae bacterium]